MLTAQEIRPGLEVCQPAARPADCSAAALRIQPQMLCKAPHSRPQRPRPRQMSGRSTAGSRQRMTAVRSNTVKDFSASIAAPQCQKLFSSHGRGAAKLALRCAPGLVSESYFFIRPTRRQTLGSPCEPRRCERPAPGGKLTIKPPMTIWTAASLLLGSAAAPMRRRGAERSRRRCAW